MVMSLHSFAMESFAPMLRSLSAILDKAEAFRRAQELDPKALPNASLAPDMYPLTMQAEIACDHAIEAMRKLGGVAPPTLARKDETLAHLKKRIDMTLEHLSKVPAAAFDNADDKTIEFPLSGAPGVFRMTGTQFLRDW